MLCILRLIFFKRHMKLRMWMVYCSRGIFHGFICFHPTYFSPSCFVLELFLGTLVMDNLHPEAHFLWQYATYEPQDADDLLLADSDVNHELILVSVHIRYLQFLPMFFLAALIIEELKGFVLNHKLWITKGSLGTLVRGVPCDLKVTGLSRGIGHWKQVRSLTIHPSGCGPSPDPAYAGCFVHRAALLLINNNKNNNN